MEPQEDTLNSLLRGELSAVESYEQVFETLRSTSGADELLRITDEHRRAADDLTRQVRSLGGEPATTSGVWGSVTQAAGGAARMLGADAMLRLLRQGEEMGIRQYEKAIHEAELSPESLALLESSLLPRSRDHIPALEGLIAGLVERIPVEEAHERLERNPEGLLVCAYEEPARFEQNRIERAMSLQEFDSRAEFLPHDHEVIFYCACPHEATSASVAEKYQDEGFTRVKVLLGGIDAWKRAGYRVVPAEASS